MENKENQEQKIKLVELVIDDESESGLSYISLVDTPAIESDFLAFKKEDFKFKIQNKEKRIVSGYFMIADLPMMRMRNDTVFYCVFRRHTIEKIVNKFMKEGLTNQTNLMHDSTAEGVYIIESLIVDSERGVAAPESFEKVPNGSWWGSMRVENDDVWNSVLDGSFKGFSVEGIFSSSKELDLQTRIIAKIRAVIKGYKN
tara:strand:- start:112 stop:711 length:600 start_codon:yes stop_codon:yes gene_type:complete